MRVMFILDYSFPMPTASSNRKISVIKALTDQGVKSDVLCIQGTSLNEDMSDNIEQSRIIYTASKFRHPNFFIRNLNRIKGRVLSFTTVIKENRKEKIDFIFLPAKLKMFSYISCFYLLTRVLNIKLMFEISEYPEILVRSRLTKLLFYVHKYYTVRLFDGGIVMTENLKKYFSGIVSRKAKIFTLPMTVDIERFNTGSEVDKKKRYIAYCGYISKEKDGVDILIKSFALISDKHKDYLLYIIGYTNDKALIDELKRLCADLEISDRVVFTGKVDNARIPKYLNEASVLALARPSSLQAQGGFPTKLGEYLATGNPVVLTDVGEITDYLKDRESAYISKPDSVDLFAQKLDECLSDRELSSEVGKKGYAVALKHFHYTSKAPELKKFLQRLITLSGKTVRIKKQPRKIAVITQAPMPSGLASTNRVIYHAKGLQDNGIKTKILVTWPTERIGNIRNNEGSGEVSGVYYEYPNKRIIRSKYFIQRRIHDTFAPFRIAFNLIRERYDAAIMVSWNSFYDITILKILLQSFGIKLIAERTELPFHSKKTNGWHKIKNKIILTYAYKNLYGFMVISKALQQLFSKLVSNNCPVILVPVMIDEKDIYRKEVVRKKDIVYTGPLSQRKDGILTIIKAFELIASEFPETNLIMTGNIEKSLDRDLINGIVDKSPYKNRMKLTGFITRDEMINYLNSAAALVMAKPSSKQADTCFPSKLGEYLSTGNPIVVTNTGEVPIFLKDGVNAFISEPDSVESFAAKLKELFSDADRSRKIGLKGRELALNEFNYKSISEKIITFIGNRREYYQKYEL